jgi:hypothetical protein
VDVYELTLVRGKQADIFELEVEMKKKGLKKKEQFVSEIPYV